MSSRSHALLTDMGRHQTARHGIFVIALAMLCWMLSNNAMAALEREIEQQAIGAANSVSWVEPRSNLVDIHPLHVQTLSVERDERKQNKGTQQVRVYQFHYELQTSRLVIVDVDTLSVVSSREIDSVHLPLNAHEAAMARQLVEADEHIMEKVKSEYATRSSVGISDLSSIDIKASIFEPNRPTHLCAQQRCALLSLFDETHTVFNIEPLVNLQQLSVTTLDHHP